LTICEDPHLETDSRAVKRQEDYESLEREKSKKRESSSNKYNSGANLAQKIRSNKLDDQEIANFKLKICD
jgi:hypothetical protein